MRSLLSIPELERLEGRCREVLHSDSGALWSALVSLAGLRRLSVALGEERLKDLMPDAEGKVRGFWVNLDEIAAMSQIVVEAKLRRKQNRPGTGDPGAGS